MIQGNSLNNDIEKFIPQLVNTFGLQNILNYLSQILNLANYPNDG